MNDGRRRLLRVSGTMFNPGDEMEVTMLGEGLYTSMDALRRLVFLALDRALSPDDADWAKQEVAAVFRAADVWRRPKCECLRKELEQAGVIRKIR